MHCCGDGRGNARSGRRRLKRRTAHKSETTEFPFARSLRKAEDVPTYVSSQSPHYLEFFTTVNSHHHHQLVDDYIDDVILS